MNDRRDLELMLGSGMPIIVVETTDETRLLELLTALARSRPATGYRPLFRWTVTDGLGRLDVELEPQRHATDPADLLRHIRATRKPGIYALLDLHPFLDDPLHIRLLKDIATDAGCAGMTLLLISHRISVPPELRGFSARFEMRLPDETARRRILDTVIAEYRQAYPGRRVEVDRQALELLALNLGGLTHADAERLARNAVFHDGAVTADDLPDVMQARYELLNRGGILSYEYDTADFADIAAFRNLKVWLKQRRTAFGANRPQGLDPPKGILLIGVQGCGKSQAAKAAAGDLKVPLLRLDFGALYNKFHGETERNLRESLQTAELMSPCVMWVDEIEKGIAAGHDESGTSRRVLATLLTWMAERDAPVFVVATANDVQQLPPELIRKGRFDEVFFVDLPEASDRGEILRIHLARRGLDPAGFDLPALVEATDGFSGAELEQGVVAALYTAHGLGEPVEGSHLLAEYRRTRPLSVLMDERIRQLRTWARGRTVPSN